MRLIGELIEVIAERAGLRNVREVGEQLTRRHDATDAGSVELPGRSAGVADVLGSDVLDFGQMVIAAMKATTGDGDPDTGARFGHGHSAFSKSGETLRSATADDDWEGAAARAYADQNTRQQLRTETMAAADLEVHRVLFREAAQITLRRGFLDDQSNFLAYTSYATFPLQFIRTWGEAAKLAIELNAVQVALGESTYHMYRLHSEVSANAAELQQAIGRYRSVSEGAEKPGADLDFGPPIPSPDGDTPPRRKFVGSPVPDGSAAPVPRVPGPTGGADASSGTTMSAPAPSFTPAPEPAPEPAIAEPSIAGAPMPVTGAPMPVAPPVPMMPVAPTAAGGSLGGLITPLAALITGAALAAAEQQEEKKDEDGRAGDETDPVGDGATARGRGERAPVPGEPDSPADGPQTPAAVRLDPDNSPGPPTGMSPQDER